MTPFISHAVLHCDADPTPRNALVTLPPVTFVPVVTCVTSVTPADPWPVSVQSLRLDGVVIELWSQLGGQRRPDLVTLVRQVAAALRHRRLTVGLVIPPPVYRGSVVSDRRAGR